MDNLDLKPDILDADVVEECSYPDGFYICQNGSFSPVSAFDVPQPERRSWLDCDKPPVFRVSNQLTLVGMLQNAVMKFAKYIFIVFGLVVFLAVIGHVVS